MNGKVKYLSEKKFGFITPDGGKKGDDCFFHKSGLSNCEFEDLEIGSSVSFETEQSDKGQKAVRINLL